jgi:hypothetical protein
VTITVGRRQWRRAESERKQTLKQPHIIAFPAPKIAIDRQAIPAARNHASLYVSSPGAISDHNCSKRNECDYSIQPWIRKVGAGRVLVVSSG